MKYGEVLSCVITPSPEQILLGFILAAVVAIASWSLRLLTPAGSVAQLLLGWLLFGLGGLQWAVPIILFFIGASLVSRLTAWRRQPGDDLFEKGYTRDAAQVLANAGVGGVLVGLWMYTGVEIFYLGYLGALAAVAADTMATEVGMTSVEMPRLITTLQPVSRGRSGAVSLRGFMAGGLAAVTIGFTGSIWIATPWPTALIAVFLGGTVGSLVDSLLGATVQLQFRCPRCLGFTETKEHCGVMTEYLRGCRLLRNDGVNLICSVSGSLSSILTYLYLLH